MTGLKKFANRYTLKLKGFSAFPPDVRILIEGFFTGLGAFGLFFAAVAFVLHLWVMFLFGVTP